MEAYTILAKYYDILMNDFDYSGYENIIKEYTKGEGIDLCCGSGTMTIALSKLGNKMMGVDLSSDMLNCARNKSRESFQNILFIESNILDFVPPHKVDFVTCVCDGFNYVSTKDLIKVFHNISSYLKPNGYLIFDISSEYKLKNILANNVFCEDSEKATYIWSNYLNKDSVSMQISFFEKQAKDLFRRIEEDHKQYIHNKEELEDILFKCDFEVKVLDGVTYKEPSETTRRQLFVCRRK